MRGSENGNEKITEQILQIPVRGICANLTIRISPESNQLQNCKGLETKTNFCKSDFLC